MSGDNAARDSEARDPAPVVTFGPLKRALREHRYPVTAAELIEQYGAAELETPTETERFGRLLEDYAETRFREPSDVRQAVFDALGYDDPPPETTAEDWSSLPR
ncbi:hypothetical protein EKH57_10700 [Halorubrum sp. BOL3-1]|uniref:DUF5789 family protein n=1 Tax=Halorubrum sp. BOL3-1 TaxID=2497325 RepID=UPI0010050F84|nr:hypothetical protein [Halorubrum sp. BOL3-1]QAU13154.1 hypothetical protein EKH57_10700 [Halorubrum sp. BOL3-1]